ncbi:methylmalonyl-CoA epimerase [bacterium]|nr:methylmalonyl-CoA epimerase [bacterium]
MLKKIDHIGIATKSLEEALPFWTVGLRLDDAHQEIVADQKVVAAFLPVGETNVELLEGTDPDSAISKFVEKRGAGIHHICFEVENIDEALAHMKEQGFKLIDETPRIGAHGKKVAFVHPKTAGGVLIELSQDVHPE